MSIHGEEIYESLVSTNGSAHRVIALGKEVDAVTERGTAIAFGAGRSACVKGPVGQAITLGGGTATAQTAVAMLSSGGTALASQIAVVLNHAGTAIGEEIAVAANLDSHAHSNRVAVALGPKGVADGLVSISLGQEGQAVAREGGIIALAFYDQAPGRWETAHGCDPCWIDGDYFLSDLKVAKVGENDVRPNFIYQLDKGGNFFEVGPARARRAPNAK